MKKAIFLVVIVLIISIFTGCAEVYEDLYFSLSSSDVSKIYLDATLRDDGKVVDKVNGIFQTPYQSGNFRFKPGQVFVIQGQDYNSDIKTTYLKVFRSGNMTKEIIIQKGSFGFQLDY